MIFANKQDLPGAKEPKELEKLLGLHELSPLCTPQQLLASASAPGSTANNIQHSTLSSLGSSGGGSSDRITTQPPTISATNCNTTHSLTSSVIPAANSGSSNSSFINIFKGWYIQPACAITGDGLQEGLEALYDMIIKRRKLNKAHKKKR